MLNRLLLLICIAVLFSGVATSQTPQFVEASQFVIGSSPLAAASGDFNSDNLPDLVATNKVDNTVSVLIAKGGGTFKSQVVYNVGGVPDSVVVGDFNHDGCPDIIATTPYVEGPITRNKIAELIGNCGGTFSTASYFSTGEAPLGIAVGDFDNDGWPDVVTANNGGSSVSVLMNSHAGFASAVNYLVGNAPMSVAAADFNSDGKLDLAVTNSCGNDPNCALSSRGTVAVLIGNGDGSFQQPASSLDVGYLPRPIAAADLNGDNKIDLAVGNFSDNSVTVLIGKGNGSFSTGVEYQSGPWEPYGIVTADFNKDGKVDLAVSNAGASSVSILLGTGSAKFPQHVEYWAGNGAGALVSADFNADSNTDLAVPDLGWSDRPDNKLSLLLGTGHGTFRSHVLYATDINPGAIATGDFNGDGIADLVVGEDPGVPESPGCGCSKISVLLSKADNTYQNYVDYPTGRFPVAVAVADFNGDGISDVAVANHGTTVSPENSVGILLGNMDGTLTQQADYVAGINPVDLIAADVNKDGKVDLIVSNQGDKTVGVLLGNGGGSFQSQVSYPLMGSPKALAIGDVNGDGIVDVAVTQPADNVVSVLIGKGDGTFGSAAAFGAGKEPVSVGIDDFNHDGNLDMAIANKGDPAISVLLGNGNGTFQAPVSYSTSSTSFNNEPSSIITTDLNADGIIDLLVSIKQDNGALLFLGKGDGTFSKTPTLYGTGWQPMAMAVRDLNGDGAMDILSANSAAHSISVIVNAGGTLVSPGVSPPNPTYGETITLSAAVNASLPWRPGPTGDVSFSDGNSQLGTVTLKGDTASFTVSDLGAGNHSLSAVYLGDSNFLRHATTALTQTITKATTTTTLTSSANPSNASQQVTFTATVVPQYSGAPSGKVKFFDGSTSLGDATLSGGVANFATSALSAGSHDITASYAADSNFLTSISPVVTQVVNAVANQDFQMTADAMSAAMTAGQSANSLVHITSVNGFSGDVVLSCSVSPAPVKAPVCSLNPSSVTASGTGATSTLTIKTTAPQSALLLHRHTGQHDKLINVAWLPILGMAFLGLNVGSRRSRKHILMGICIGLLLVVSLMLQLGCGGGSSSAPPNTGTGGTPAGAYTVTVTGKYGTGTGALSHQTALTITVQ